MVDKMSTRARVRQEMSENDELTYESTHSLEATMGMAGSGWTAED